jgi:hypothetical protein
MHNVQTASPALCANRDRYRLGVHRTRAVLLAMPLGLNVDVGCVLTLGIGLEAGQVQSVLAKQVRERIEVELGAVAARDQCATRGG